MRARLRVVFVEAELLALHAGVDAIRASHVDAFTGSVDYRSMRRSAAFARLRDAHAVTLARVDAEAVDAARRVAEEEEEDPANRRRLSDDDDEKNCTPSRRRLFRDASLAFLINVYNLSARIAPATVGAAASSLARGAYFDAVRTELSRGGQAQFQRPRERTHPPQPASAVRHSVANSPTKRPTTWRGSFARSRPPPRSTLACTSP